MENREHAGGTGEQTGTPGDSGKTDTQSGEHWTPKTKQQKNENHNNKSENCQKNYFKNV